MNSSLPLLVAFLLSLPLLWFIYKITIRNANAIFKTFGSVHEFINIYFSQYHCYFFDSNNILLSFKYLARFVSSWIIITFTLYMGFVFTFEYILTTHVSHPDTLFLMIVLSATAIRYHVFRNGRQSAEILSVIVSIVFFVIITTMALIKLYDLIEPTLVKYNLALITSYFSSHKELSTRLLGSLPTNIYIVYLALVVFFWLELICYGHDKTQVDVVHCGPWSLCYSIHSNIERYSGQRNIMEKAKAIINKANELQQELVWVTTTKNDLIFNLISKSDYLARKEIIVITDKNDYYHKMTDDVNLYFCNTIYPCGFLLVPGHEILITTHSLRAMKSVAPDLGFYTTDISVLTKYHNIYEEMLVRASAR